MRYSWPLLVLQFVLELVHGGERCPVPILENGRAREKVKFARNVRFNCRREYQLLGNKYAHCVRGSWDVEIPVCIRPGCKWLRQEHMNGLFLESYRGAFVKVFCNPGYSTLGPSTVYCNGQKWNGTFPHCKPKDPEPHLSCDFEPGRDLCGWSHDPDNKGPDWRITSGSARFHTNVNHSSPISTQPSGQYIHIDSSGTGLKNANSVSRLYSPVYRAFTNNVTCFSLWYYIHGAGTLKVYMLEEEDLRKVIPDIWIEDSQENYWKKSVMIISPERDFQIVLEGSNGQVAVDDVSIEFDEKCLGPTDMDSLTTRESASTTTEAFDTKEDFTCRDRCADDAVLIGTDITSHLLGESPKCTCHSSCTASNSCCHDYLQLCDYSTSSSTGFLEVSTSAQTIVELEEVTTRDQLSRYSVPNATAKSILVDSSTVRHTLTTPTSPAAVALPATAPTIYTVTSTSKPNGSKIITTTSKRMFSKTSTTLLKSGLTVATPSARTTTLKPVVPRTISTSKATETPTSTSTTLKSVKVLPQNKNTLAPSTATKNPSTHKASTTNTPSKTTKRYTKRPFLSNSTAQEPGHGISSGASEETELSNHIPILGFPPKSKFQDNIPNNEQSVRKFPDINSAGKGEAKGRLGLSVVAEAAAGAAVTIIILTLLAAFLRRRIQRRRDSSNLVEDSDVRFLTSSDEDLDFTLASPTDSEL